MNEKEENVYTNSVMLTLAPYDIILDVGFQVGSKREHAVNIIMSWQHAKKLSQLLDQQIVQYEEMYGEINTEVAPGIIEKLEKEKKIQIIKQDKNE